MTGEKDHIPDTGKMVPAAIPTEEEIARVIHASPVFQPAHGPWRDDVMAAGQQHCVKAARAILDIFAPILAKKERAEQALEAYMKCAAALIDKAEARALAAESALAAERERCATIVEDWVALGRPDEASAAIRANDAP